MKWRLRLVLAAICVGLCGISSAQTTAPTTNLSAIAKLFDAQIAASSARLTPPATYEPVGKALAVLCQSDPFFFRDENGMPPAWAPPALLKLEPRAVQITADRADVEFGGGFYHFGYQLKRDQTIADDKLNHWTLEFCSEGSPNKSLETFTLNKTDHVAAKDFVNGALDEFERRAKSSSDTGDTVHDRLVFLLKFDQVALARKSITDCAAVNQKDWADQLLKYLLQAKADANASLRLKQWAEQQGSWSAQMLAAYAFGLAGDDDSAEQCVKIAQTQSIDEPDWLTTNARYRAATVCLQLLKSRRYQTCAALCDALLADGSDDYLKPEISAVRYLAKRAKASDPPAAPPPFEYGTIFGPFKGIDLARLTEGGDAATQPTSRPSGPVTDPKQARMIAYFETRTAGDPSPRNYDVEIGYLVTIKRTADALAVCNTAAAAYPKWWLPQLTRAELADPNSKKEAAADLEKWVRDNPSFIHWWYLYCYDRDSAQYNEAVTALQNAVKYPLDDDDLNSDTRLSPQGFAYEAATYAYQMKNYQLVLDMTRVWASPRGIEKYFDNNIYAFRAAAELSLGQFADAKADAAKAVQARSKQALYTQHLAELQKAANEQNRDYVYDPGWGMGWMLFDPSEYQN